MGTAVSRMPFAAGADRLLPDAFGRVHPHWHTPHVALVTLGVVASGLLLLSQLGDTMRVAYQEIVSLTFIGGFLPYIYIFLSTWKAKHKVAGLVGLGITLFCLLCSMMPTSEVKNVWLFEGKLAPVLCFAGVESKFNTSKIDSVLGRSGTWIGGLCVVLFPRPDLRVVLQGVRLSTAPVVSFVTFMGSEDESEMMGEMCALSCEMTPAIAKLRAGGIAIAGAHNLSRRIAAPHVHFMAQGQAVEMARSFRAALAVTITPLGAQRLRRR